MKKKLILIISLIIFIIISFIVWNNRTVSTVTLDINPSIKISFNKNKIVKKVEAINEDAKEIIKDELKGYTLEEVIKNITEKVIDLGYAKDNYVVVLVHSAGNVNNDEVTNILDSSFRKKEVYADIIVIDNITKEEEKLARQYGITPAKASYINNMLEENKNLNIKTLTNKSINELKETEETGNYCPEDYTLEGTLCFKEIGREKGNFGKVCPVGYLDYEGVCYEETGVLEKEDSLICGEQFTLKGTQCVKTITMDAHPSKYKCTTGVARTRSELSLTGANDGDANDVICVDYSSATHPVSPCELNDGTEYMVAGGICYWHRAPIIAEGCPGKIHVNGSCWDDASSVLICYGNRDGKQYNSREEYCENSIKYYDPVITEYKCLEDFTLNNNKCVKEEVEPARKERYCEEGYTKTENDRCINYNNVKDYIDGYKCDKDNTKVEGDTCIVFEIVEAYHR